MDDEILLMTTPSAHQHHHHMPTLSKVMNMNTRDVERAFQDHPDYIHAIASPAYQERMDELNTIRDSNMGRSGGGGGGKGANFRRILTDDLSQVVPDFQTNSSSNASESGSEMSFSDTIDPPSTGGIAQDLSSLEAEISMNGLTLKGKNSNSHITSGMTDEQLLGRSCVSLDGNEKLQSFLIDLDKNTKVSNTVGDHESAYGAMMDLFAYVFSGMTPPEDTLNSWSSSDVRSLCGTLPYPVLASLARGIKTEHYQTKNSSVIYDAVLSELNRRRMEYDRHMKTNGGTPDSLNTKISPLKRIYSALMNGQCDRTHQSLRAHLNIDRTTDKNLQQTYFKCVGYE